MQNYNYIIAIVRIIMSFEVVIVHFLVSSESSVGRFFLSFKWIAVPVFMIIAFYYSGDLGPKEIALKRIRRLGIPYLFWTFSIFIYEELFSFFHKFESLTIQDLLWQLACGYGFIPHFWYLLSLILITIIWHFIFKHVSPRNIVFVALGLTIISVVVEYFRIDFFLFSKLENISSFASCDVIFGRTIEMIPYSCSGVLIREYLSKSHFHKYMFKILVPLIVLMLFIYVYYSSNAFFCGNYGYGGVVYLGLASFIVLGALSIKTNILKNDIIKKVVYIISNHTLGIYCIHFTVGRHLISFLYKYGFRNMGNILFCLVVWCISLLITLALTCILPASFKRVLL